MPSSLPAQIYLLPLQESAHARHRHDDGVLLPARTRPRHVRMDGARAMTHDDARTWFTAEVAVHLDAVYRYFVRRAPRQDADDLAAEVFTTAWRRHDDIPQEAILPWLYKTAGFTLANHRRRAAVLPLQAMPELSTPDHADRAAMRDELSRALAQLTERERNVLLLHAWEGLDGNALAEALELSRSGAQSALSRARAHLREVWAAGDSAAALTSEQEEPVA